MKMLWPAVRVRSVCARLAVATACVALAACSGPTPAPDDASDVAPPDDAAGGDAVASDDGGPMADATAWDVGAHDPLPQVPNQGGAIIAHPQLVVISFADDPDRADHEADARWIVRSDWLHATGAEYGVGDGTVLGVVNRTDNAPDMVTDAQIQQLIAAGITDGSIPRPAGGDLANAIYVVYYPHHTTITHPRLGAPGTETSCVNFGGYHLMAHQGGMDFAYAVVASCDNLLPPLNARQSAEFYLSHELVEAATDPDPAGAASYQLPVGSPPSPWAVSIGGELGDLCTFEAEYVVQNGFFATRIWSNAVALAGRDNPCVPQTDPTRPYFNMSATPSYLALHAGELGVVDLHGWSNGPVADWTVSSQSSGSFTPQLMVRSGRLNNGRSTQLGITVPAGTPSGTYAIVYVIADGGMAGAFLWPVLVVVQ